MKDNSITRNRQTESSWEACPPGIIKRVASRSIDLKRRQFMIESSATVAVAGGGFLLLGYLMTTAGKNPDGQNLDREFTCVETRKNLDEFITDELDEALAARISEHLQICKSCKAVFQAKLAQLT